MLQPAAADRRAATRAFGDLAILANDFEPFRLAQVLVRALVVRMPQNTVGDIGDREVGDRVEEKRENFPRNGP